MLVRQIPLWCFFIFPFLEKQFYCLSFRFDMTADYQHCSIYTHLTPLRPTNCMQYMRRVRKIAKSLASPCLSVSPSVRTEQLGSYCRNVHEILYQSSFRKSVEKIRVSLKSDKNKRYFTLRPIYTFDHISVISSLSETYFKRCRETRETHFMFNNILSEIMPFKG